MIAGVGLDVVEVARFRAVVERRGESFLRRLFTEREIDYCMRRRDPALHLAARFAAKVSVVKAAGGFKAAAPGNVAAFGGIEILSDGSGRPLVAAPALAGLKFSVTMTHDAGLSMAAAIAEFARPVRAVEEDEGR